MNTCLKLHAPLYCFVFSDVCFGKFELDNYIFDNPMIDVSKTTKTPATGV